MIRYIVTHEEHGILVAAAMGFVFWSRGDSVGQTRAVAFDSEAQARDYVGTWLVGTGSDGYGFEPVKTTEDGPCVSVREMLDAGLNDYVGDMWANCEELAHC